MKKPDRSCGQWQIINYVYILWARRWDEPATPHLIWSSPWLKTSWSSDPALVWRYKNNIRTWTGANTDISIKRISTYISDVCINRKLCCSVPHCWISLITFRWKICLVIKWQMRNKQREREIKQLVYEVTVERERQHPRHSGFCCISSIMSFRAGKCPANQMSTFIFNCPCS